MAYTRKEDVYRVSGLPSDGSAVSDDDVELVIEAAENDVERLLGTCFQIDGRSYTETFSGNGWSFAFLSKYPIITLTSLSIDGTSVTPANVYLWKHTGQLKLKDGAEMTRFNATTPLNCIAVYTYGEEPDERVKNFTALVAAEKLLVARMGGIYSAVQRYSLPEMTADSVDQLGATKASLEAISSRIRAYFDNGLVRIKPQFG